MLRKISLMIAAVTLAILAGCTAPPPPFEAKVVSVTRFSPGGFDSEEAIIEAKLVDNGKTFVAKCSIKSNVDCGRLRKGDIIVVESRGTEYIAGVTKKS